MLGMVGIGELFVTGDGYFPGTISQAVGALSVLLTRVSVAGGFVITRSMLDMSKSNEWFATILGSLLTNPVIVDIHPKYSWLYGIPAVVSRRISGSSLHWHGGSDTMYLAGSILCVGSSFVSVHWNFWFLTELLLGSLSGLSSLLPSQATAHQGNANALEILGVSSGIPESSLLSPEVLAQFAAVATTGHIIRRRITATELVQLLSVVGLMVVLTSIGGVIDTAAEHISTLHLVMAYVGVVIGESYLFSLTRPASRLFANAVTVKAW
jgi:hypothetical protein